MGISLRGIPTLIEEKLKYLDRFNIQRMVDKGEDQEDKQDTFCVIGPAGGRFIIPAEYFSEVMDGFKEIIAKDRE